MHLLIVKGTLQMYRIINLFRKLSEQSFCSCTLCIICMLDNGLLFSVTFELFTTVFLFLYFLLDFMSRLLGVKKFQINLNIIGDVTEAMHTIY